MPIPQQSKIRRALLEYLSEHDQAPIRTVFDALAAQFALSDYEKKERLPSGNDFRFENRVKWAKQDLSAAGLLETPERGIWRITSKGKEALSQGGEFDRAFLHQFPEYLEKRRKHVGNGRPSIDVQQEEESETNPEEILEESFQAIRETLAIELLDKVKTASPRFFEQLVVDLLVAMGYGGSRKDAGQAVGQSGDGGIDGIIKEDKLGLDAIYIQAKRWQNTVGRPEIQAFAGSLEGIRARKGVFITTSRFTRDALDYVERIEKKIILIDGEQLAHLMIEHGVGVSETARYVVKKIDLDYFETE